MPFDEQEIELQLGSLTWNAEYVRILTEEQTISFDDNFEMIGFYKVATSQINLLQTNPEDKKQYSVLKAKIKIRR